MLEEGSLQAALEEIVPQAFQSYVVPLCFAQGLAWLSQGSVFFMLSNTLIFQMLPEFTPVDMNHIDPISESPGFETVVLGVKP
ncbi:MAG TPA: hypothetical protein VHS80_01920 [Chthoniobacterales bacterium]|nr:hypothetical protein [Chthoniobacterales bacterium]